jgi:hypothetical protein
MHSSALLLEALLCLLSATSSVNLVGSFTCCRYLCGSSRPGAEPEQLPELAGAALLCSAPGTGNDALVQRIARKSFVKAAKLTWCAAAMGALHGCNARILACAVSHAALHSLAQVTREPGRLMRWACMRRAMVSKNFLKNATACREMFFSEELPETELERYQGLLREHASDVSVIKVRPAKCRKRGPFRHLSLRASSP